MKMLSDLFISKNHTSEFAIERKNRLSSILYDCIEDETLELFDPLFKLITNCSLMFEQRNRSLEHKKQRSSLLQTEFKCDLSDQSFHRYFTIWQIKFASLYIDQLARPIPKLKYIESTRFRLEKMINESIDKEALKSYLNGQPLNDLIDDSLIEAIVYYHIDCQNRGENATKNMYRSADRRIFNLINVDE